MRIRLTLGALFMLAAPLWSQGATALYSRWNALSGFEFQRYGFAQGLVVQSASQWSLPLVVVAPLGRQMSLDLTTHLAHSQITDSAGTSVDFTGLTDTQLRLLYTVGRDRAVASLSVNLPTGKHSFSATQFGVSSAVGSNFLSFPVSNLGTSFGITGGLAYAVPADGWNVGLAGSVRYQSRYRPLSDSSATLSYDPGLESRLRIGADRLIGQRGRFLLGFTYSSFSTDQFSGGALVNGWFNPGSRFIGDVGYAYTWGRSTLTLGAWDFYRLSGRSSTDTAGTNESNENIFNTELRLARQLSPRVVIEPLVGYRHWNLGGRLYSFGVNGRFGISDSFSGIASARVSPGSVDGAHVTGLGLSLLLRYQR